MIERLQEGDEIAEMTEDFKRKLSNRLRVCNIFIDQWDIDVNDIPEEFK